MDWIYLLTLELFIHGIKPKNSDNCINEKLTFYVEMEIEVDIHHWNQHIPSITLVLLPLDLSKSLLLVAKFRISKASLSETSISVQIKQGVCVKKMKGKVKRGVWKWKWKWNLEQGEWWKCEEWSEALCNQQLRAFLSSMRRLVAFRFPCQPLSLVIFAYSSSFSLFIFLFLCAFLKHQIQNHSFYKKGKKKIY